MADRQFLISKNIDASEVTTKQLDVNRYINLRNSAIRYNGKIIKNCITNFQQENLILY